MFVILLFNHFRWVNSPLCEGCGNETVNQGMGLANSSETAYGASRVEIYRYGQMLNNSSTVILYC